MVANWCVQNVQTSQEIKLEFHAERNIAKVMVETESMRPNDRSFPFFPDTIIYLIESKGEFIFLWKHESR